MPTPRQRARASRELNVTATECQRPPKSPETQKFGELVFDGLSATTKVEIPAETDEGTSLPGSSTFLLPINDESQVCPTTTAAPTPTIMLEAPPSTEQPLETTPSEALLTVTTASATAAALADTSLATTVATTATPVETAELLSSTTSLKSAVTGPLENTLPTTELPNSQTLVSENPAQEDSMKADGSSDSQSVEMTTTEATTKDLAAKETGIPQLDTPASDQESIDIGNINNNSSHNSSVSLNQSVSSRRSSRRINQDQSNVVTPARQVIRKSGGRSSNSSSLNESGSSSVRRQSVGALMRCAVTKQSFEIGELVWALNTGDPMWPAKIVDPKDVHPTMRSYFQTKKITGPSYYVFFYGDPCLARLSVAKLFPFKENLELFKDACKRKKFLRGLELILTHPDASIPQVQQIWDNCVVSVKRQAQKHDTDESGESSGSESEDEESPRKVVKKNTPGRKKKLLTPVKEEATSSPGATTAGRRMSKRTTPASYEQSSRKRRNSPDDTEKISNGSKPSASKRLKMSDTPIVDLTINSKKSKSSKSKSEQSATKRARKTPKVAVDPKSAFISRMIQEIQPRLVALTNPNWAQPADALRVIRFILQRLFVNQKEHGFEGPPIADCSLHVIDWDLIKFSLDAIKDYVHSKYADVMVLREHRIIRVIRMLHGQKYEPLIEKAMKENEVRAKLSYLLRLFTTYRFRVEENAAEETPAATEAGVADENSEKNATAGGKAVSTRGSKEPSENGKESPAKENDMAPVSESQNSAAAEKTSQVQKEFSNAKESLGADAVSVVSDNATEEAEDMSRRVRPSTPTEPLES